MGATSSKPTLTISKKDKTWTIKSQSTLKDVLLTATEGVGFTEGNFNLIYPSNMFRVNFLQFPHGNCEKWFELTEKFV